MAPFVFHIPHASTTIPAHHRASLLLSDAELEWEAKRMADLYTDELFGLDADMGQAIVFPVSRLVVDVERFCDDADEPMSSKGMGVLYQRTSTGGVLRHPPSVEERQALLAEFYEPHHERLTKAVNNSLSANGWALVVDCHSFPAKPRDYDADQSPDRPDICLGTDGYHTPPWLAGLAEAHFKTAGWSVAVNSPFSGTLVPGKFKSNSKVCGLMIEINRALYLDEATDEKSATFHKFKAKFQQALSKLMLHLHQVQTHVEPRPSPELAALFFPLPLPEICGKPGDFLFALRGLAATRGNLSETISPTGEKGWVVFHPETIEYKHFFWAVAPVLRTRNVRCEVVVVGDGWVRGAKLGYDSGMALNYTFKPALAQLCKFVGCPLPN